MDLITSFIQPCLSWAGDALVRQIGYLKAKTITKELAEAIRDLEAKRNDIQTEIDAAAREQKQCTQQVQRWLEKINKTEGDATVIQSDYERSGCGLLGAHVPNCWSSYRTGRRATKLLVKVKDLEEERAGFGDILTPQPPKPVREINPSTSIKEGTVMASYLDKVRRFLEEEEDGYVIGIWGMGGVGKTTLLEAINNDYLHHSAAAATCAKLFDHVIFVVVSKDHSLEKLQESIRESLGLPSSNSVQLQAAVIFDFLKEKNFLLLLDDAWETVDLKALGIPSSACATNNTDAQQRRKVIVTTRSEEVCSLMDSRKRVKVECLGEEEAWNLFKKKVGEELLNSHPELVSLAQEVAKECGGLPLALIVIGRAMSTKRTLEAWDYAITHLRKSQPSKISGMENFMYPILKYSYDSLHDDRTRDCFLCCSLWPEDYEIIKEDLIVVWMGLDLINDFDDINEAYNSGHFVIESLIAASLLEPVRDCVKMHDVIRDLALWIACGCGKERNRWIVKARANLEHVPNDMTTKWGETKQISLMLNDIRELPQNLPAAYCPNLSVLFLQNNSFSEIPVGFLRCMPNLTFLDLSRNCDLEEIPNEIGCLVQLRYLNLSYTAISSLPDELGQLSNLKYLLVGFRTRGRVSIPMRVLSSLSKLEFLDLFPDSELCSGYDDDDELTTSLSLLSRLKGLGVKIRSFENLQRLSHQYQVPIIRLSVEDMGDVSPNSSSSFHILHQFNSVTHKSLRELIFHDCQSIREVVVDIGTTLPRLEMLQLDKLENMREIVWRRNVVPSEYCFRRLCKLTIYKCPLLTDITWILHLPLLEDLCVSSCDAMEQLIIGRQVALTDQETELAQLVNSNITTFPCLRELDLIGLPRLCDIISSDYALLNFPSLETVKVIHCPELKKLPFRPQLNCNQLNKIGCSRTWWESIEWEDEGINSSLQSLVEFLY